MEKDKEYLSKAKYDNLAAELHELKTVRRRDIAKQIEYAKSLGDLSENAEYQAAREEQADIEDRIKQLEDLLKRAVIVSEHHSSRVEVGTTVVVKRKDRATEEIFTLVGSEEADIIKGRISNNSPLGSALLGKKKGELVTVMTPKGEAEYTIVDIK